MDHADAWHNFTQTHQIHDSLTKARFKPATNAIISAYEPPRQATPWRSRADWAPPSSLQARR